MLDLCPALQNFAPPFRLFPFVAFMNREHQPHLITCKPLQQCYNTCMNKQSKITKPLKIIKVGNSAGLILPKDVLARLRVSAGDVLDVVDNGDDGLEIRRHDEDSEFSNQMAAAREVMERRKRALRELAK
jgi:putative addiction module antidote